MKAKVKKEINFKNIYKLPLKIDSLRNDYVYSANGTKTFNIVTGNISLVKRVLSIINGETEDTIKNEVTYSGGYIYLKGKRILYIQGYDELTNKEKMNLSSHHAILLQDEFCKWVVGKLKGE